MEHGLHFALMRPKLYKVLAWKDLGFWGGVVRAYSPENAWLRFALETDCPSDAAHTVEEIKNEKQS